MTTENAGGEGPGFVGIRFCQECNNMLYPKEDKVATVEMTKIKFVLSPLNFLVARITKCYW